MKVLIDIPNIPKNDHQRWVLTHGGIVLDGLTNGEVFHKVFPDVDVDGDIMFWHGVDWWNRKWGKKE